MIDFDIVVSLPDLDNLHLYDYCNIRKNLGLANFMQVSAKATSVYKSNELWSRYGYFD